MGPWMTAMATLIDVLREEHRNIARLLDALEHQVQTFATGGAPDYDVVLGVADYFLDYPDLCHHPKEDLIFARLRERHTLRATALGDLLAEHRAIHLQARRFRATVGMLLGETDIAGSVIVEAAQSFIAAERRHMRREEDHFLPMAEQLLTEFDWSVIETQLKQSADPLFGDAIETRFKALAERLIAWERESTS
jgi:hemerythrin-like domain-containing protein